MYVVDATVRTGIVNSLFGGGAAAAVLTSYVENGTGPLPSGPVPCVLDFESFCMPEQWASMRFDWNDSAGKWSCYVGRDIPYVIGFNVREPLERPLVRNGLDFSAIKHWVLNTGGGRPDGTARRSNWRRRRASSPGPPGNEGNGGNRAGRGRSKKA